MNRLAIFVLSTLLASGCSRPLVILTDAISDEVRKAIGAKVEVDGIGSIGKDEDFIRAKNFGALVSPATGQMMRQNHQAIRVRGVLREQERPFGRKAFLIENAEILPK